MREDSQSQAKAHFIGQLLNFDFSSSPHLEGVLNDPQQIYDRALIYLMEYFRELARQNLIIILLEDIHWADESSLEMIYRLALALREHQVLIMGATRPTLFERSARWGNLETFQKILHLHPLSKNESRQLVEEILKKVENIPEPLLKLIIGNAEGNPFYVEELIKMFIEDGVIIKGEYHWRVTLNRLTEVHIPPTLTGVLQSRLDRLTTTERTILQQASVVGRIFWEGTVQYINRKSAADLHDEQVTQTLLDLQGREMVFKREVSAFSGTNEHIFKHTLMQEVT